MNRKANIREEDVFTMAIIQKVIKRVINNKHKKKESLMQQA